MSDMDISRVIDQMRALKAQAQGLNIETPAPVEQAERLDFSALLKSSVEKVNELSMEAGRLNKAFEAGDPNVDITQVMVALQKAGVSFRAMTEVRNKLVQAYKDIMNMPI